MNTAIIRFFSSKLMLWIAAIVVSSYFIFSLNFKSLEKISPDASWDEKIRTYFSVVRMPRLKLGIDLQGGTYLVLGVEVEKAIENRLVSESKALDKLFRRKNLAHLPIKKEVKNNNVVMEFEEEEYARICYNLIRAEIPSLRVFLKGSIVMANLSPVEEQRIRRGAVEQAVAVLNNRLSGFGVEGISVQQHGDKQVVVQMPGIDDPERVKAIITKTAHLEFKIVEKTAKKKEDLLDEFDGDLPPDKMIIPGSKPKGIEFYEDEDEGVEVWYLVSAFPDLTGEHIIDAKVSFDEFNKVEVAFALDTAGARIFRRLTGDNMGRRLGIIVDDVMISAPTISTVIGAQGRITGLSSSDEAKDLALVLRSGALMAPLKLSLIHI